MTIKVYGRATRSSGGATDHHHKRGIYFTDVSRAHIHPKKGLVGPKMSVKPHARHPGYVAMRPKQAHLRLRRLPCGHGVFMLKGMFPSQALIDDCPWCADGTPVR